MTVAQADERMEQTNPAQPVNISTRRPKRSTVQEGDQGEHQHDRAGDHDVEEDRTDAIAGLAEEFLGVVEDRR